MTLYSAIIRLVPHTGTLQELSAAYCAKRDFTGEGASSFGPVIVRNSFGNAAGHISYNGRVWPGFPHEWHSALTPLYDNRIEA